MKRIFIVLLSVLIIFSVCSCSATSDNNSNPTTDQSNQSSISSQVDNISSTSSDTVNGNEVEIIVSLPAGWEKNEDSVLDVHYIKDGVSFMIKTENFSGTTLTEVVNEAKDIYDDTFDNVVFSGEAEDITIDGKAAKKLFFSCDVGNYSMKYLYAYLFVNQEIYVITFGGLDSTFDSML